jgi:hypothetical protein
VLPDGLTQDSGLDLDYTSAIAVALDKQLLIAPRQRVDISRALAHSINLGLSRTFGRDVKRATDLAHIGSFDAGLVSDLVHALERDKHKPVGMLRLSGPGRTDVSESTVSKWSWRTLFGIEDQRVSESVQSLQYKVGLRRQHLLSSLKGLTALDGKWSDSAIAWRSYVLCLLSMSIPDLVDHARDHANKIERTLRIVNDRESGVAKAREGIQLVRTKM